MNSHLNAIPVLQPIRAANEDFATRLPVLGPVFPPKAGWDAREVWRTRIKTPPARG